MTKERAEILIRTYGEAWEKRDANLILTIFTPNATYFDPKEGVQVGHAGIRAYWETKVIGSQKDITFRLLHLWIDGDTVIAEWNAAFIDTERHLQVDMMEVAIFEVKDDIFCSLREYHRTTKNPV
jgi:ketosteroid isomerase-like protein